MTTFAFGEGAGAWSRRFAPSAPLIVSDLPSVPQAIFENARRRKAGERFAAALLLDDRRARCAMFSAAPPIFAQVTDYDERARLLDAVAARQLTVGGRSQADLEADDPRYLRSAVEFLVLADAVVTRSSVERERLSTLLGRRFAYSAEIAPLDPRVPAPGARGGPRAIVVWAPDYPAEACGILAFALEEFTRPAFIICAGGEPPSMRSGTRYVGLAGAAEVLAQAGVIVDASLADPGAARALASWAVPLAVAATSGAADWLDGVAVFDPWNHLSIAAAVANAAGMRPPYERRPAAAGAEAELARVLAQTEPVLPPEPPLVSVIVPTLNERSSLRDAVASIAAQTYPNVELVLVNDGGPPIDAALVAGWTQAVVVDLPQRGGVASALNAGIAAARGTYIANLADDDTFCPDHLAQLVAPLEALGGSVAHAIELRDNYVAAPDGSYALAGHALMVGEPARRTGLQIANVIGGPSIMVARAAYAAVGPFDERAGFVSDLEMWMQLSERFDFIHVDRVTAVMSCRNDPTQISSVTGAQAAACLQYVYALHPTARPAIARAREKFIRYNQGAPA